jgi:thiamine monophosphate kinase
VKAIAEKHGLRLSCIGEITEEKGLNFISVAGERKNISGTGFKHF